MSSSFALLAFGAARLSLSFKSLPSSSPAFLSSAYYRIDYQVDSSETATLDYFLGVDMSQNPNQI